MGRIWGKSLRWEIPIPDLASIYAGMGTGMRVVLEAGDGDGKVVLGPALPHCHP